MAIPVKAILLTKTTSYRHLCIPTVVESLSNIPWLSLRATEDSSVTVHLLHDIDILILGHTTGSYLDQEESAAVQAFVSRGGNIIGIHAATVAMETQDWYKEMLGASFDGHPVPQWGNVTIHNPEHFINKSVPMPQMLHAPPAAPPCPRELISSSSPTNFPWFDEFYNFCFLPQISLSREILLSVDESSYSGGKHGSNHPLAWCHQIGGARVFYTSLGHFSEAYQDKWFMGMLERGIQWAAGREDM